MIRKLWNIYIILIMILASGSVFFTLEFTNQTKIVLVLSSLIMLAAGMIMKNIRISKQNVSRFVIITSIMSISCLINFNNGVKINNLIMFILILFSLVLVQDNITSKDFIKCYINIILILSVISLICFYGSEYISMYNFPFYKQQYLGDYSFSFSFYHTWGWAGFGEVRFDRNCGIFSEPGVFQCYLNMALIFITSNVEYYSLKKKSIYIIIFIIAIFSTKSTTGYIIMMFILIYAILTDKIKLTRYRYLSIGLTAIIGIGIISYAVDTNVIQDKFETSNSSYSIRKNDTVGTISIIQENLFSGVGYVSDKLIEEQYDRGVYNNSNGLLLFTAQFGVLILVIFLFLLYKGINGSFMNKKIEALLMLIIIIVMYNTEYIMMYPIWLSFIFRWKSEESIK